MPFSLSSASLPRHPFVRLAIAAHMISSAALYDLIEASLIVIATGTSSVEVLLALFILSLAPFPPDTSQAPITSLRCIALAYSLGQTLGLDTVSKVCAACPLLAHDSWSGKLAEILLVRWVHVVTRVSADACSGKPSAIGTPCRSQNRYNMGQSGADC